RGAHRTAEGAVNRLSRRQLLALGATTVAAAVVAGCSDEGDGGADLTLPPPTTAPTTTEAATTTTGAGEASTTTTVPAGGPVMPLTGLPVADPAIAARPALVVKIDNHSQARPQSGLNAADVVFEENVENLTRFAAVFHSQDADPVGP